MTTIVQTNCFKKTIKKLTTQEKQHLDLAVKNMVKQPSIGETKIGNLAAVRVYKFKRSIKLMLLAYTFDATQQILTLLALASHENFYRDLKKQNAGYCIIQ